MKGTKVRNALKKNRSKFLYLILWLGLLLRMESKRRYIMMPMPANIPSSSVKEERAKKMPPIIE